LKKLYKFSVVISVFFLLLPVILLAGQYKVIRVVDGDTIVVNYHGKYEKVRLLCVNTPESVHRDKKQNVPMGKVPRSTQNTGSTENTLILSLKTG